MIFSALAVEAYSNGLLEEFLSEEDVADLDRLSAVDKLLKGPLRAGIDSPLECGREPIQTIQELLRARNRLVHPRRSGHGSYIQYVDEGDERTFGPSAAGRFILSVARVIAELEAVCGGRISLAGNSKSLREFPEVIDELVDAVGPTIGWVIREGDECPADPLDEAERRRVERFRRERPEEGSDSP